MRAFGLELAPSYLAHHLDVTEGFFDGQFEDQ